MAMELARGVVVRLDVPMFHIVHVKGRFSGIVCAVLYAWRGGLPDEPAYARPYMTPCGILYSRYRQSHDLLLGTCQRTDAKTVTCFWCLVLWDTPPIHPWMDCRSSTEFPEWAVECARGMSCEP